ncbi:Uncharacterised protein [Mycobacteroides abscessus subsp. abscessus]|nr:Uncharacterised protein [Mycobacteroides abscessus subsp. abscessus]
MSLSGEDRVEMSLSGEDRVEMSLSGKGHVHRGSLRASSAPNNPSARFQPSANRDATS